MWLVLLPVEPKLKKSAIWTTKKMPEGSNANCLPPNVLGFTTRFPWFPCVFKRGVVLFLFHQLKPCYMFWLNRNPTTSTQIFEWARQYRNKSSRRSWTQPGKSHWLSVRCTLDPHGLSLWLYVLTHSLKHQKCLFSLQGKASSWGNHLALWQLSNEKKGLSSPDLSCGSSAFLKSFFCLSERAGI